MLKLKKLRWSGIGRFVEEQVVDFESLGSLVQVDGQNNNTGGSSGAGKSTIFHALDWLLGIGNIPNTVLKCRYSEEGMFVEGTFDFDGLPLVITRGKKLSINLDGKITTGSSKITEEELDRILAIPRELFRKMLHKRQKEGGFFLQMTPSEINSFLVDCLGLGEFKKKLEKLDLKIKEFTEKKVSNESSLKASESALKATKDAILSLGQPPEKDIDQEAIVALRAKLDSSSSALSETQNRHKLELDTLNISRPQITQASPDITRKEELERELKLTRDKKSHLVLAERDRQVKLNEWISAHKADEIDFGRLIKEAEKAKTEAVRIALEIKKIRESTCPTCEQNWATENAKATETAYLEKLATLKEAMRSGTDASERIVGIRADINRWTEEAKPRVAEGLQENEDKENELVDLISKEKAKHEEFTSTQNTLNRVGLDRFAYSQKELQDTHRVELAQFRDQADADRRAFEAAAGKLRSYEEARSRYERSLLSLQAQKKTYCDKVSELAVLSTQTHNQLLVAEELKRAVKSYLSCTFDEALETIGDNATRMIRSIPNMASSTVVLEGIRENKDGAIKEEVTCVIHMDGEENIPIKSLSGGERTALDLAIDLSSIDFIETKANRGTDFFVLDEPFNGMDSVGIEMALEVLKNSNTGKKLIIVDHNPEAKQIVVDKILVIRDGLISRIERQ